MIFTTDKSPISARGGFLTDKGYEIPNNSEFALSYFFITSLIINSRFQFSSYFHELYEK